MRDFGLCRICFRELANEGIIPGIDGSARAYAERMVTDLVRRKAPLYGTHESEIRLEVSERAGTMATGETVFLEMTVEGAIAGKPAISEPRA